MDNKLLEFSEKLNAKKVNDKKIKEEITFYLGYRSNMVFVNNPYITLIKLDQEDLEYFKKKYLPKIEDEYQANLAELNKKYNK